MSSLKRLISEIHHRSLWQVLLIYVGGAWFCYEIIDTIADRMALPMWLPVLAILLSLLGLPFVVATAFVREGEPGIEVVYGRSRLRQHDLRHSRITWLLAEGAPIQTVQGLAGHSTVKMTERYYRYLHEHQRILVERAGTLGTFLHRSRRPQQVE